MKVTTSATLSVLLLLTPVSANQRQQTVVGPGSQRNQPALDANPPRQKSPARQETPDASKQHALALLDELTAKTKDFAPGLFTPIRVSLAQADIAEVLWQYDQERARALLENALKSAETIRPRRDAQFTYHPMASKLQAVELEIIDVALNHDPAFAERLTTTILQASEAAGPAGAGRDESFRSEQRDLYSQIAKSIAASNPQHAADLIKTSFNGSFGEDQVIALDSLRRRDPELADQVFLYALILLKDEYAKSSGKVGMLAPYVMPDLLSKEGFFRSLYDRGTRLEASPMVTKAYLEFVYEVLIQRSASSLTADSSGLEIAGFDTFTMRELLKRYDKHLPDKAPEIRARVGKIIIGLQEAGRQDEMDLDSLVESLNAKVQDLVHDAETAQSQLEKDIGTPMQ